MTLPGQSRSANIKDSWKKYLNDNVKSSSVYVTFDNAMKQPKVQGKAMDRWVTCKIGQYLSGVLATQIVELWCCTRRDSEGYKAAQLRDTVYGLLTDSEDVFKRIPLYRSHPTEAWTVIGQMLIKKDWIIDSGESEGDDNSKIRKLTIKTRFASGF